MATTSNSAESGPLAEGKLIITARSHYEDQSAQSSNSLRALAIAMIAVSWLFLLNGGDKPFSTLESLESQPILVAAILASVFTLIFDTMQYTVSAFMWGRYTRLLSRVTRADASDSTWKAADRAGLTRYILDETGENSDQLRSSADLTIKHVRTLFDDYRSSTLSDRRRDALWAALSRPESPRKFVLASRLLYWLKVCATAVSAFLVAAFFISNL